MSRVKTLGGMDLRAIAAMVALLTATPVCAAPVRAKKSAPTLPEASGVVLLERSAVESMSSEAGMVVSSPAAFMAGVSSWAPSGLSLPSNLADTTALRLNGLPGFYLGISRPAFGRDFALKLGASWTSLYREAPVALGGAVLKQSQTVNLFSARLGLEYASLALETRWIRPMAALVAMPSLGVGTRAGFDSSSTYRGVLGELSLGARIPVTSGLELEAAGVGTLGSLGTGHAEGLGVNVGMRITL